MNSGILSAEQAAVLLRCPAQKVRERLKRGLWCFGRAYSPEETGLKQWTYEVYADQLESFMKCLP